MGILICESCGSKNDSKNYFCSEMWKIFVAGDFLKSDISSEVELKLSRIVGKSRKIHIQTYYGTIR